MRRRGCDQGTQGTNTARRKDHVTKLLATGGNASVLKSSSALFFCEELEPGKGGPFGRRSGSGDLTCWARWGLGLEI